MGKKRTQPKLPEGYELLMAPIHALMSLHGFDTKQEGKSRMYNKPYYDGYSGTLRCDIRMYGPDRAYVEFSGIGIDKSRQMEYGRADLTKLENRIKRLKRKAYDVYMQHQRKSARNTDRYIDIADRLDARGITDHKMCEYTGRADIVVNGYEVHVDNELKVSAKIGGHFVDVDVQVAIDILNSLPTKTEED